VLAAGLFALLACDLTAPAGARSLPGGFPADFPVYSGASLSSAGTPKANKYDASWTSAEMGEVLFDWYSTHLNRGDYRVRSTVPGAGGGLIDFSKKSRAGGYGGAIRLADRRIHVIMGDGCPCEIPS
jgi:hypothetical protein